MCLLKHQTLLVYRTEFSSAVANLTLTLPPIEQDTYVTVRPPEIFRSIFKLAQLIKYPEIKMETNTAKQIALWLFPFKFTKTDTAHARDSLTLSSKRALSSVTARLLPLFKLTSPSTRLDANVSPHSTSLQTKLIWIAFAKILLLAPSLLLSPSRLLILLL